MGKPGDKLWHHWYVNGNSASCNYCKSHQRKHATRCRKHTSSCLQAPTTVRKEFQDKIVDKAIIASERLQTTIVKINSIQTEDNIETPNVIIQDIKVEDETPSQPINNAAPSSLQFGETDGAVFSIGKPIAASSSYRQRLLDGHVNRISTTELKELQKLFTKAMISGNVAFNWLQDVHLKLFFEKIGSGFITPSRWEASHSILDKLEQEATSKIMERLHMEWFFSLIPDGWTNVKGLSVVNVLLANTFSSLFYKSFETGDKTQTGDYLKEEFCRIINEINGNFGVEKIVAIVSDRGSNYLNARNQIQASHPGILSIHCAAHVLNLVVGDLGKLPSVQTHLNKAKSIVKEIKNSKTKLGEYYAEFDRYIEDEKLEQRIHQKVSLSLPSITRWFGIRDMLYKLKCAKNVLLRLAIKENTMLSATSKRTLMEESFWYKLDRLYPLFTILTNGIAAVESSECCLSDVVEEFEKLKNVFQTSGLQHNILKEGLNAAELRKAMQIFENRSSDEIITLYHYLSNLLDPRFAGRCFIGDQTKMINVLNKLESYAEHVGVAVTEEKRRELGRQLTSFRMKSGYFSSNMLFHPKPLLYWNNYLQFAETNLLALVAIRLFSIPGSSADVERSFSVQAYVHSKSRNRLTDKSVDKIMRVKWHLRQEEKQRQLDLRMNKHISNAQTNIKEVEPEIDEHDIDEIIYFDEPFTEDELLT